MGRRQKPRFRMVLPVSVWGTDSDGKHFHQLAYTLDISTGGARLAGLAAKLQKGDTIGVKYKQRKAPFRVVWTANNQVGIQYAEAGKFIWIELPETDFVDREPVGERGIMDEQLSSGDPRVGAASSQNGFESQPAPQAEPEPPGPVPVQTTKRDELAARLEDCLDALRKVNTLIDAAGIIPQASQAFHAATGHVRNSAWAIEQALELQEKSAETAVVIESISSEKVRFLIQLCRELLEEEQQDPFGGISDEMRKALVAAVETMAERLGATLGAANPSIAQQPAARWRDNVSLLAWFNDEIRSSNLSAEQRLELIAARAAEFTDADGAAVGVLENDELVCCASSGAAPPVGLRFPASDGLTGEAILKQQPIICSDTENDARVDADLCRSVGLRSSAIVPIVSAETVAGVLQVFSGKPNVFNSNSLSLLENLAEFVAPVEISMRANLEQR
jgi:putative methionine-R-sulfoxide reductase with GAF domain